VHDEQLVRRQHDSRLLPAPHSPQGDERRGRLQRDADDRHRPPDRHQADPERREAERARERRRQYDRMTPLVEADAFPG